jgi:4'-phosphopantetheinyl transferase
MTAGVLTIYRVTGDPHQVLQTVVPGPLAAGPNGKPYLPDTPHIKFNLSKTRGLSLVAIALDVEVGVDIERLRPVPELAAIADRFLPPGDAEALADTPETDRNREFFRRWTRAEALWKATGLGLFAAGSTIEGEWIVREIDMGEEYAAAVAMARPLEVRILEPE